MKVGIALGHSQPARCGVCNRMNVGIALGHSQNHLAVAGGSKRSGFDGSLWRTHPLPRGGTDRAQE